MNNETFKDHLENAVKHLLEVNNIDYINNKKEARLFVKNNIYAMVNIHIDSVLEKLLP
jgi:hypothetical protein